MVAKKKIAILIFLVAWIAGNTISAQAQLKGSFKSVAGMSTSQIQAIEIALSTALLKASASAKTKLTNITNGQGAVVGFVSTMTVDEIFRCAVGGTIHSTWIQKTMSEIANDLSATGSINGSGHQIISGWKCVKGWIIDGDPYLSRLLSGKMFAGSTSMNYYLSGGWKALGPNKAKQSCQVTGNRQSSNNILGGVSTVHVSCVPGGKTDTTMRW